MMTLAAAVAPSLDRIGLVPRRLDWLAAGVWIGGSLTILGLWAIRWGRIAAIVRAGTPIADGRTVDALRQLEHRAGVTRPIALIASDGPLEPGVFGVLRPKPPWPPAIETHLS